MMWRSGEVVSLGKKWDGCVECQVRLDDGTQVRALAYTEIVGTPVASARVILSASAAVKKLGTGGYYMVVAFPDDLPPDPETVEGHIVKARYTPTQYMTMGADEQDSPWHDLLRDADSINGMPVIVADLHSALAPVVAAIHARRAGARIAYIMDDGAALPAWFSQTCAKLRESGMIFGTITAGQAFGGQLEAVNVHTALLAARHVWKADIAIVSQGPGNLGTGTHWGFSGTRVGDSINAAAALQGRPIGLLRMSNGDARGRHFGLSHHSVTALTRVAMVPTLCPVPVYDSGVLSMMVDRDTRDRVEEQVRELFACRRLARLDISTAGLDEAFVASPIEMRTMGRSLIEDPLAFLAAGVAGYAATALL
ncbi:MAG: DUF3866 family protein [Actinomycetaceae bacterium]|nr:DUF3866 family protein [Actinomycetaceae bacterium]